MVKSAHYHIVPKGQGFVCTLSIEIERGLGSVFGGRGGSAITKGGPPSYVAYSAGTEVGAKLSGEQNSGAMQVIQRRRPTSSEANLATKRGEANFLGKQNEGPE